MPLSAVPIATGAASPFVTEFLNQGVDGMRQAEVNREELRLDEAGFFGAGSSEVNELRDTYATMAEENGISVDFAYGAQLDMGRAYIAGQGYAENHGVATLPTEEP